MPQVQNRIDQILQQTLQAYEQQNNSFTNARNQVINKGLQTPVLKQAPQNINLFDALGTTNGKAAFIGTQLQTGRKSLVSSGELRNTAIANALLNGQKSLDANVAQQNQIATQQAQQTNANTMALLGLQKPTINLGNLLSTMGSRQNTKESIAARKELAKLKGGAVKLSDRLRIASLLAKLPKTNPEDRRTITQMEQRNIGDVSVQRIKKDGKVVATIVNTNKPPEPLPDAAILANQNAEQQNIQSEVLGGLIPTDTKLWVMAPEANNSMFSGITDGLTPNLYAKPKEISIPPKDYPYVQPILKQFNYDLTATLNFINSNIDTPMQPEQAQALANFKATYEPQLATAVETVPETGNTVPLSNLPPRQFK